MPVSDSSPATAVERALNILEAAAHRRDGLTNSEISRKLGIPKSSASYILRTLERRGYLRRDAETGRYRLGLKILSLGGDAQANLDIADVSLPFMRALEEKIHMTVTKLLADLERVKEEGYAVDDEENSLGARCLGAPVFDVAGNVVAALGASGTLTQVDEASVPRLTEAVKETARRISRQLQRSG